MHPYVSGTVAALHHAEMRAVADRTRLIRALRRRRAATELRPELAPELPPVLAFPVRNSTRRRPADDTAA
jgi:hypothetical protein